MEDFSLVLKELIKKDIEKININLSESLKKEFEITAENYFNRGLILESIKVFALTKNIEKLKSIGGYCLAKKENELALKAFYFAKDKSGLDQTGTAFMANGEVKEALLAYKLAENQEMVTFLEQNFQKF